MTESTHDGMVVVFTLAGESYALPITKVQEIVRYTPPREVASTERGNRGVISLRGKIIPVYDLAAGLGGRAPTTTLGSSSPPPRAQQRASSSTTSTRS